MVNFQESPHLEKRSWLNKDLNLGPLDSLQPTTETQNLSSIEFNQLFNQRTQYELYLRKII